MVEHTFADGVGRLTLPLPTGPKHVHCYVVDGTLFDTGLGLGEVEWPAVDRIAITHMHPDHVGGAEAAAAATGAPVSQGGLDYAQCERVWGSDDWPERIASWFRSHGVPLESTRRADRAGARVRAVRPLPARPGTALRGE
jgi:glyoxylase-like metal-dependent hydrolase (beta-lactamase superfamily II)